MAAHRRGHRLGQALVWAALLLAGRAQADEVDEVAQRIGACFGREDPTCAEPLVKRLGELTPGAVSLDYSRGFVDLLAGRLEAARPLLQRVAGSQAPPQHGSARGSARRARPGTG